jgi:pimeloyl-ACP methyl ester carboxylesterase
LTVPEERSSTNGKTIRLHVAVFKSTSTTPAPDPVVFLAGGPGGHALEGVPISDAWFAPFLSDRDFIIFDQRGTGYSEPALDCPEFVDLAYNTLDDDLRAQEAAKRTIETALQCHDRLASQGINLAAYNDSENTADLNDLRLALGYDQWNLYGVSYGTLLALNAMRDFPAGIRSVILDSTLPPQVPGPLDSPANADRVLNTLFDGCAKDVDCNQAYPNLKDTFYRLVDRLNQQPVVENLIHPDDGKSYTVLLNGDRVLFAIYQALYQSSYIPVLPAVIDNASKGIDLLGYWVLADLMVKGAEQEKGSSAGMYYSTVCNKQIPFLSRDQVAAASDKYPQQHDVFERSEFFDICAKWGAKAAPARVNDPVKSQIAALVLAGEYDPVTPPSYGRLAADGLSHSSYFLFPGLGHGVSTAGECPLSITKAFLNAPTQSPDSSCIQQMRGPAFDAPKYAPTATVN